MKNFLILALILMLAACGGVNPLASESEVSPTPRPTVAAAQAAAQTAPRPTATPRDTTAETRELRLIVLDEECRSSSYETCIKNAGYSYTSISFSARQPEEEILGNKLLITGFQVEVRGLTVAYPAGMTTDRPVVGDCIQPDPNNPSKLCTNVTNFHGPATLWLDVSNWSQLAP